MADRRALRPVHGARVTMDQSEVLALSVLAGLVFALGWFPLRSRLGKLTALHSERTVEHGPMVFVVGIFVMLIVVESVHVTLGRPPSEEGFTLASVMTAQTIANVVGVGLMLWIASRQPEGVASAGLRPHVGPSPWIIALCSWLAFLPFLLVVVLINRWLYDEMGWEQLPQRALELFSDDPDARLSPWVWLSIGLLNPVMEEMAFRGVLFGGLRRAFSAPMAIGFSAAIFAALHDPSAFLPVAALGVLLAWTYERTGSLIVPCLVHCLHNTATLIMVTGGLPI